MQRARHETPPPPPPLPLPQEYDDEPEYEPAPVHPLHRYAAQQPQHAAQQPQYAAHQPPPPPQDYDEAPQQYADEPQHDPSRYDDALYGRLETGEHDYQRDPAYPDDPYAYQGEEYEEEPAPKKRSRGLMTIAAVLALAVVGTGAAFAYRTFVGSPRSGEPPIIRADNSPTKVVPAPSDAGAGKTPDRLLQGDGGEKLVSREETPVDVNSRSGGPRVVFPPLNQNANPPPAASVSPSAPMTTAANGTMPNNEPRRIRTLAVKGDPADNGGVPAGASAPPRPAPPTRGVVAAPAVAPGPGPTTPPARNPASANASANPPMSLAPQADFPAADPDGGDQSSPDSRPGRWWLSGPGLLAKERGRRAGLLSRAPRQVPERAGAALVAGEACRSRRKGHLLPRLRWPVRLVRGGGAGLQQPEICRRAVLRPKELTAVSLTPVP